MPELFWIIVGYTAVLTICFLVGEYLKDRRTAKKHPHRCQKEPERPELSENSEEVSIPEDPPTDP